MGNQTKKINNAPDNESGDGTIYLLISGQKEGPFSIAEIRKKMAAKEILYGQLISQDKGKTWIKIHEVPEIIKAPKGESQLPHLPEQASFFFSNNETYVHLRSDVGEKLKAEQVSLAIATNKDKKGGNPPSHKLSPHLNKILELEAQKKHRLFLILSFCMALLIFTISILNYFYSKDLPRTHWGQRPKEENILKGLIKKKEFKKISQELKQATPILDENEKEKLSRQKKKSADKKKTTVKNNKKSYGEEENYYDNEQEEFLLEENDSANEMPLNESAEANSQESEIITQKDIDTYRRNNNQLQNISEKTKPRGAGQPAVIENLYENESRSTDSFDE